jgi:hypothetical protein
MDSKTARKVDAKRLGAEISQEVFLTQPSILSWTPQENTNLMNLPNTPGIV